MVLPPTSQSLCASAPAVAALRLAAGQAGRCAGRSCPARSLPPNRHIWSPPQSAHLERRTRGSTWEAEKWETIGGQIWWFAAQSGPLAAHLLTALFSVLQCLRLMKQYRQQWQYPSTSPSPHIHLNPPLPPTTTHTPQSTPTPHSPSLPH